MLLLKIETYLRRTRTPPTRFGREAVRDPRFVYDLRRGRTVSDRVRLRVLAFIEERSQ